MHSQQCGVTNAVVWQLRKHVRSRTTPSISPKYARYNKKWLRSVKGEVYHLTAKGSGHEQKGQRYAVVLQPDWLTLSTWIVAFTSTRARPASFRPEVTIADRETRVMCDQLTTVDLSRLSEPAGFLTIDEMRLVDEALALVLDL